MSPLSNYLSTIFWSGSLINSWTYDTFFKDGVTSLKSHQKSTNQLIIYISQLEGLIKL